LLFSSSAAAAAALNADGAPIWSNPLPPPAGSSNVVAAVA
jgi:hypothetical protein